MTMSGPNLPEACLAAAKLIYPSRSGVHYRFDVLPRLLSWGLTVRGIDIGASTDRAMSEAPRFTRVAGRRAPPLGFGSRVGG
jgi:hypothetical protein